MYRPLRVTGHLRVAGLLLLLLLISGCASTPFADHLLQHPPVDLLPPWELTEVAFFPQEIHQCGPAALATVLHATTPAITPDLLTSEIYVPGLQGSLQPEILAATRRHGLIPYEITPNLENLLQQVHAGHPVLVLQNLGLNWLPQWHYAVVVGYDLQKQLLVLRSGTERRHEVGLHTFERTWQRAQHWGAIALTPGKLPAQPEEWRYIQAIVGLEKLHHWQELQQAYEAGIAFWPHSPELRLGLGNLHYVQGDKQAAEQQFSAVLVDNPDYAPAHNNLAEVLAERGAYTEALGHAQQAVQLGGVHSAIYLTTLNEIQALILKHDDSKKRHGAP